MYDRKDEFLIIGTVITLLLFPIVIIALKRKLFKDFGFPSLMKVLNFALLLQLAVAAFLLLATFIISKTSFDTDTVDITSYNSKDEIHFSDMFMGIVLTYFNLGLMIYLSGMLILNIINWIRLIFLRVVKPRNFH